MIPIDDLRGMQTLAQEVFRLRPEVVDMTMGELAYHGGLGRSGALDGAAHRLWRQDREVVAWAIFWPPGGLEWQVHPGRPQLLDDVLDWFESLATGSDLATQVRTADLDAERTIRARGFARDAAAPFMLLNSRTLTDVDEPRIPTGYRLRTVDDYDGDIGARVAVHRAAWAELGTRVTEETYRGVMETWPYRSDLDCVLEDSAGRPVAFALAWYDEENRVGELEPVGTDPAARRRGLARAVNLFALDRLRASGATRAIVACRGDDAYVAPRRLYESVGFSELSRQRKYVRSRR